MRTFLVEGIYFHFHQTNSLSSLSLLVVFSKSYLIMYVAGVSKNGQSQDQTQGQGRDSKIVDNLVSEIKRGNVLRRLSMKRKTNGLTKNTESVRL